MAEKSEGYSGAEIEQAVISALFDAFYEDREVADHDIAKALAETVPLSRTMDKEIDALRSWCMTRARHASLPQTEVVGEARRKLELD